MAKTVKIKRGLDIPLKGNASSVIREDRSTHLYGIVPDDFPGHTWKVRVKPGDAVRVGDVLLSDKADDAIALTSPVAGVVEEIRRGERRHIMAVTVRQAEEGESYREFEKATTPEGVRALLQASGLWAMMRQRPFDTVPAADSVARDIYVTAFDSAPLAGAMLESSQADDFEAGLKAMASLTQGTLYVGIRAGETVSLPNGVRNIEVLEMVGPHPAGNAGVQIAATRPVNKGETVWTLDSRTVARVGALLRTGRVDWTTLVDVTGENAQNPRRVRTRIGAALSTLLEGFTKGAASDRIISGNVLTGIKVDMKDGFLRYPYRQITIIEEGDQADEFMGWASLSPAKFSVKRNFPAFLRGLSKPFSFDARIKGGHRAMIVSEEYDKVFPFDILPEYLLKAIMARDIEKMEQLGIYEVAPEDFALPEFVDTSKIELQKIVREGLDYLRSEL